MRRDTHELARGIGFFEGRGAGYVERVSVK
jgi:hypothetical protein